MSGKGVKKPVAKSAGKSSGKKSSGAAKTFHASHGHLFSKNPRNFGIGRAVRPKVDLSRYVKWPRYIRLQRQRAILKKRLKVPPAINQFAKALDKNQAANLFSLLARYRPESRQEKTLRLKTAAESEVKGAEPKATSKPFFVKYGLNHITELVESKKAKLVVIAHDVDPIELVVWLPALCRKMNVPYAIVKGKARLGHVVHKKSVAALAVTEVRKEDQPKLEQFVSNVNLQFKDNVTDRKKWGGGLVGIKATHVIKKKEKQIARELAKRA
jgi:large subunit ribosomal protein L7Ae